MPDGLILRGASESAAHFDISSIGDTMSSGQTKARSENMERIAVEIEGGLAEELKESAKAMGVTVRELIVHVLLQFVESFSDSEEEDDESEDEDEGSSEDEEA